MDCAGKKTLCVHAIVHPHTATNAERGEVRGGEELLTPLPGDTWPIYIVLCCASVPHPFCISWIFSRALLSHTLFINFILRVVFWKQTQITTHMHKKIPDILPFLFILC